MLRDIRSVTVARSSPSHCVRRPRGPRTELLRVHRHSDSVARALERPASGFSACRECCVSACLVAGCGGGVSRGFLLHDLRTYGFTDPPPSLPVPRSGRETRIYESSWCRWVPRPRLETLHTDTQRMSAVRANAIFVVLLCVAAPMSTVALNWCCIACILRCKSAAVSVHIRGDTRVGWRALYTVCRLYKGDTVQPRQRVRSGRSVLVHLTASHTAETPWRRRLPVVAFEGPSAQTTRTWAPRTEPERDMPAAAAQHAPCTDG